MSDVIAVFVDRGLQLLSPVKHGLAGWMVLSAIILAVLAHDPLFPHRHEAGMVQAYLASYWPLMLKWGYPVLQGLFYLMVGSMVIYAIMTDRWSPIGQRVRSVLDVSLALVLPLTCLYVSLLILARPTPGAVWQTIEYDFAVVGSLMLYGMAFVGRLACALPIWARQQNMR